MASNFSPGVSTRERLWDGRGWSPVTMFRFLKDGRNWQGVSAFYKNLIANNLSLRNIGLISGEECLLGANWADQLEKYELSLDNEAPEGTSFERKTYKIALSFFGPTFDGWASNKDSYSVEGVVFAALKELIGDEHLNISCAGRTDKGVSACAQVISFYTWKVLTLNQILKAINAAAPDEIRAWFIEQVPRSFHATFSAKWRRYIYLLPLTRNSQLNESSLDCEVDMDLDINIEKVQALLSPLEGIQRDYYAFARDTPQKCSYECFIYKCRAFKASIPSQWGDGVNPCTTNDSDYHQIPCLCIEVIADRFLRKMMRVLVSTVIRESIPEGARHGDDDLEALVKLVEARDRLLTAPPAPSEGLCLAGVGYKSM
eukprot:g4765.t1